MDQLLNGLNALFNFYWLQLVNYINNLISNVFFQFWFSLIIFGIIISLLVKLITLKNNRGD